jgi:HKD family nuclease
MRTTFLDGKHAQSALSQLIKSCDSMEWAVAWATMNQVVEEALRHPAKIRRMVVGTHFYQTHPDVLERLSPLPEARVMPPEGDLFHPKVYLFRDKGSETVQAVVGSHNLTNAAMNNNVEASVLLEGTVEDPTIAELCAFVQRSWSQAQRIDSEFLYAYSAQHRSKQNARDELSKFIPIRPPHDLRTDRAPHSMSWAEYVRKVRTTPRKHPLKHRLEVLRRARDIFAARRQFADMSEEDRKLVAGTLGRVRAIQEDGVDYNLFGSMSNGSFAKLVNRSPALLSKALDEIPLSGPVSEARFDRFIEIFLSAFSAAERKGGLPTATRLLAMKRPDAFVCVNNGNREDLCSHFGTAPTTTDLTNYWDRIIEPMMTTEWWQEAPKPSDPLEQDIWNGRAALLDVIYFKGKE